MCGCVSEWVEGGCSDVRCLRMYKQLVNVEIELHGFGKQRKCVKPEKITNDKATVSIIIIVLVDLGWVRFLSLTR